MPKHPERWLLGLAASIVVALLAAYWLHLRAIPAPLRYVPIENEAYVVSAQLGEMWRALEPHLAPYFDTPASDHQGVQPGSESNREQLEPAASARESNSSEESGLRSSARELKSDLKKKNIALSKPEDLAGVGVDARLPAAAALVRWKGELHWLVVLPLLDRARLVEALEKFLGKCSEAVEGAPGAIRRVAGTSVAFADDGWALLSDDPGMLQHALQGSERRLAYWRSSDRIGRAFAAPLPSTTGAPQAWLHGRLRASEPLPPGSEFYFALAVDGQTLAFDGRTVLPRAHSQFVADLLRAETERSPERMLARTDLGLSLGSAALPAILRDLSTLLESVGIRPFGGRFAPVLEELRRGDGVLRLGVAVSDTRQRVPSVVMGLEMSAADADAFVLRLQSSLRVARDNEVLLSAGRRHRRQPSDKAMPDVTALLRSGEIAPEQGALWHRYQWQGETVVAKPPLTAQDFAGDVYNRTTAGGLALRYLMPPFTANDLEHRFAKDRDELQVDELLADRYRLCSTYSGDTLWIGNDEPVLVDWIAHLAKDPPSSAFAEIANLGPGALRAKALGLAQPARLLEAAQLYPDNEINRLARGDFSDLAPFRAVLVRC